MTIGEGIFWAAVAAGIVTLIVTGHGIWVWFPILILASLWMMS